jgi:hypothetical protein
MSDLQCPATVLLIAHESLAAGARPAFLGSRNLSGVFVASAAAENDPGALAAATRMAEAGGWRLSTLADVADGDGLARAMEDLADLHRGETVAIVATREMIQAALGVAAPAADMIVVDIDASGWRVRRE